MVNTLIGAGIALVSAFIGAFINHFLGERRLVNQLSRALFLELIANQTRLKESINESKSFILPYRFDFGAYLSGRNTGLLMRLPAEIQGKLFSLYTSLQVLDATVLSDLLGIKSMDFTSQKQTREGLIKDIDDIFNDFTSRYKVTKFQK